MFVTVCHQRLSVVIGNDVRDDDDKPTYELFRPASMDILLDIGTPAHRRRFYLLHAIGHAYDHLVGRVAADDVEGDQNRLATIDAQLTQDLDRQGGEEALHALFGDSVIPRIPEHVPGDPLYVPIAEEGAEHPLDLWCPGCGDPHKWEAAGKGSPRFDPRIDGYAIRVALACPTCGKTWQWTQRCSDQGTPWPKIVRPPTVLHERAELVAT